MKSTSSSLITRMVTNLPLTERWEMAFVSIVMIVAMRAVLPKMNPPLGS